MIKRLLKISRYVSVKGNVKSMQLPRLTMDIYSKLAQNWQHNMVISLNLWPSVYLNVSIKSNQFLIIASLWACINIKVLFVINYINMVKLRAGMKCYQTNKWNSIYFNFMTILYYLDYFWDCNNLLYTGIYLYRGYTILHQ